ncbi:NAD(P)/FAD-dependent oxidoreductase [Rhizobium bangladeshense]|uniref:NAD(P)/FAD-dependent oxidoreductase n=1 Tax=Rhizobium bangladeshense TaxID=1138189 RepID=UPI0028C49214|nr:FAD-dependent oxidoreductase [Rhizobium bangladeshense]
MVPALYGTALSDEWQALAPGLKTIHEAREIRHRLLLAFEKAERADSPAEKQALLTSIIIGGGPSGVEMAGAISELGRFMISKDFRDLQPDHLRVLLVEAGPRILAAFPKHLSAYATRYLEKIGVEVRTGSRVVEITKDGANIGGTFVSAGSIIWGAGVKVSPAHRWLGLSGTAGNRIPVDDQLRVHGFEDVYAFGDTAALIGTDEKPLPALAQVAKQQGIYLGRQLRKKPSIRGSGLRLPQQRQYSRHRAQRHRFRLRPVDPERKAGMAVVGNRARVSAYQLRKAASRQNPVDLALSHA